MYTPGSFDPVDALLERPGFVALFLQAFALEDGIHARPRSTPAHCPSNFAGIVPLMVKGDDASLLLLTSPLPNDAASLLMKRRDYIPLLRGRASVDVEM